MTEVSGLAEPVITPGTASTPVSGSNNQLASWTHDANGNVISDGVFTYTWDALNRLVQVEENANIIASYAYDSQNRRISKTVGANTTHYIYDLNSQLIAETLADGTPLRDYFYLEGQPLAVREYQNTPGLYYFLNDHLGTPQQLITPSGTVVWQAAYLPYGEAQVITETVHNNLRFPGQYFDAETGLQYNWNRYYDPETGRYISADPIGLAGGLNLYAYVGGNPINAIDPEGLRFARGPLRGPVPQGPPTPIPQAPNILEPFGRMPDPINPSEKPLFPNIGGFVCLKWECKDPRDKNSGFCPVPNWQQGPWISNRGSSLPSQDSSCTCVEYKRIENGF